MTLVRFAPIAQSQALAVDAWWRENRRAARFSFANELQRTVELLKRFPALGAVYALNRIPKVRRIYMPRVGYHVYYELGLLGPEDVVYVLAVWNATRGHGPNLATLGPPRP